MWQIINDSLEKRGPFSLSTWKEEFVKEWDGLTPGLGSNFLSSVKGRLKRFIALEGDVIKCFFICSFPLNVFSIV